MDCQSHVLRIYFDSSKSSAFHITPTYLPTYLPT